MRINFLHSRTEVLRGASCAKTHFIHCLGGSYLVNIRLNATLLQPRVCLLSEILNRERSKFCYITHIYTVTNRLSLGLRKQARNENNKKIYIYI